MSTAAENIETLRAYPLDQGARSDARANVEKLRQLQPSAMLATARRILPGATRGAPMRARATARTIANPTIALS